MFQQDVNTTYDLKDATYEIVIMLLVAFILGYLLRWVMSKKSTVMVHTDESSGLLVQLGKTQTELENCIQEKASLKKSLTVEFSGQIEELKSKLTTTRNDLEDCLAHKAKTTKKIPEPGSPDDLKIIEGVGPAIEKILYQAGINSYKSLANSSEETLREVMSNAGSRFKVHDPSTWPEQARLATNGSWDELKLLQERLNSENS